MATIKNTHGGARPGAGRKPKPRPPDPFAGINDPLEFLLAVMRSDVAPAARRVRAAIALLPYFYVKAMPAAPEKPAKPAAPVAQITRFRPTQPPRLQ